MHVCGFSQLSQFLRLNNTQHLMRVKMANCDCMSEMNNYSLLQNLLAHFSACFIIMTWVQLQSGHMWIVHGTKSLLNQKYEYRPYLIIHTGLSILKVLNHSAFPQLCIAIDTFILIAVVHVHSYTIHVIKKLNKIWWGHRYRCRQWQTILMHGIMLQK